MHLGELLADRVAGIEGGHRLLEHHGHPVAAQAFGRRRVEVLALERERTRAPHRVAGEQTHQRQRRHRLAAAGLPDDAQRFAALDRKRDVAHGVQGAGRRGEIDRQPVHREQRHLTPSRPAR
jgi:hypothetical protein